MPMMISLLYSVTWHTNAPSSECKVWEARNKSNIYMLNQFKGMLSWKKGKKKGNKEKKRKKLPWHTI